MIVGVEYSPYYRSVVASYFNDKGQIDYVMKKVSSSDLFNWKTSNRPTQWRNWDESFVRKVPSEKWLSPLRLEEIIIEKFSPEEKAKLYSDINLPMKYYLDIEIKLEDNTFPEPELAEKEVNLISFCNDDGTCYILSTMGELSTEDIERMQNEVIEYFANFDLNITLKYVHFDEEEEMLKFFFHKLLPKIPFITGWNVVDFDWKYLMNRCKNLNINPTQNLISNKTVTRNKLPLHTGILDYMQVFEKLKPYKVVENLKLDYISNLVLGVRKLQTQYESMLEAQKDVFNFIKYNVIDVFLPKLIEDKLKLLEVAFAISSVAQISVNKVFSPIYITEMLMCREFLGKNRKMASDHKLKIGATTYTGAYVMPPIPGYYKYVACYDFASMYPSIQRQYNISPEAFLGKIDGLKLKGNEITTKNNTVFSSENDSVSRIILSRLYNERVETKKQMKKLKKGKLISN